MADQAVLTKQDLPEIIQRYSTGESLGTLAKESGVNRSTVYRWMLAGIGDKDFESVVTDCLVNRVSDADEMLETAADACNVSRAREIARFARMDLERRRPHLYGPKQETKIDTSITVIIQHVEPVSLNAPVILQAEAQAEPCLDETQAE